MLSIFCGYFSFRLEEEERMRREELRATIAMKNERSKVISNEKEEYKKVVCILSLLTFQIRRTFRLKVD